MISSGIISFMSATCSTQCNYTHALARVCVLSWAKTACANVTLSPLTLGLLCGFCLLLVMFRWLTSPANTKLHSPALKSKKKTKKTKREENALPRTPCAGDMKDCMNRPERLLGVGWDLLTCCHWCKRHCFPPHTAPVLGKHAEPVEQSGPGETQTARVGNDHMF